MFPSRIRKYAPAAAATIIINVVSYSIKMICCWMGWYWIFDDVFDVLPDDHFS